MGWVLTILFAVVAGLVFLLGWHSLGLICECTVLTEARAQGTIGLFVVAGFIGGGVMEVMFG